jgi:peptidoglycan LD-endopeptidase LytH
MSLAAKRVIILLGVSMIIMAALALLLLIFQFAYFARRGADPASPAPPMARSSPRASPVTGQSPILPANPTPPAGRDTPVNGGAARPVEQVGLIKRGELIIPVVGIRPEQLRDTYNESRSEGRAHNALDIMAGCGTPVIAALTGKIIKLFRSVRGGVTIYQMGADNRTVYYYAHLARYADGLTEGHLARQGEVIGYVGDTGNVVPGDCHLHFAIWSVTDPKRYWDGENINPYPLLRP